MFDLLATVLAWFYELWPSYGMAIVLLTLLVMLILTPLTLKGTRSMMMMQALQPEVKKLQQRYKDDRQKLNEELLGFYRENKINPLGGCFPLLIQLPVFFVLYQVLYKLTRIGSDGNFEPSYLSHDSALYKALRGTDEMVSWGTDLSRSATKAMSESFGQAIPYLVLIVAVAATSYIQQKQVSGRNPNMPVNPQQQMLMRVLPAFFAFISINFPAALVVYFLVSNLFRIGQQALISHTIYKPAVANGLFETKATEVTDAPAVLDKPSSTRKPSRTSSSNSSVERRGFLDRLLGDGRPRGEKTDAEPAKPTAKPPAKPPAKRG
ncbi:MAG: YidC/Oxa1 family membrane protein insertase, partial [bacterium]